MIFDVDANFPFLTQGSLSSTTLLQKVNLSDKRAKLVKGIQIFLI